MELEGGRGETQLDATVTYLPEVYATQAGAGKMVSIVGVERRGIGGCGHRSTAALHRLASETVPHESACFRYATEADNTRAIPAEAIIPINHAVRETVHDYGSSIYGASQHEGVNTAATSTPLSPPLTFDCGTNECT